MKPRKVIIIFLFAIILLITLFWYFDRFKFAKEVKEERIRRDSTMKVNGLTDTSILLPYEIYKKVLLDSIMKVNKQ